MSITRTIDIEQFLSACARRFPAPHLPLLLDLIEQAPDERERCVDYLTSKRSYELALDLELCHYTACLSLFTPASFAMILPIYLYNAVLHLDDGELAGLGHLTFYQTVLALEPAEVIPSSHESSRDCIIQLLRLTISFHDIFEQDAPGYQRRGYDIKMKRRLSALSSGI